MFSTFLKVRYRNFESPNMKLSLSDGFILFLYQDSIDTKNSLEKEVFMRKF